MFANAKPPERERIAVIGAGPAGLGLRVAGRGRQFGDGVRQGGRPGGSFRFAGMAPMFQEVEADPASLERYIDDMVAGCEPRA